MSPIEAERGVRPRGVMDFDPSLLHEVNGETLTNPTATAGKHQAAVKAHLDDLIGVWEDMEENRNSVQFFRNNTDNTVAMSYVNKMGGRVPYLSFVVEALWEYLLERGSQIRMDFLPGVQNV